MTGLTDPDVLPFAYRPDFADVQQFYELAMRVDGYAQAADVAFNATYRPRSFQLTASAQVSYGGGNIFTNLAPQFDTINWNTSAGRVANGFTQNLSEPPSWWLLGAWVPVVNISGTGSTSTHVDVEIFSASQDYATGAVQTQRTVAQANGPSGFRSNAEGNNGGEVMTCITIVPLYKGTAHPELRVYTPAAGDTAVRGVAANANFWGIRLGPVFV